MHLPRWTWFAQYCAVFDERLLHLFEEGWFLVKELIVFVSIKIPQDADDDEDEDENAVDMAEAIKPPIPVPAAPEPAPKQDRSFVPRKFTKKDAVCDAFCR